MSITNVKVLEKKPSLTTKISELSEYIGNTPLFAIKNLVKNPNARVFAKLEWQQFGGSVKARPAYEIIYNAIQSGELSGQKTLIDASSGNTAIAYAHIAARIGIKATICMPENASEERKQRLRSLGANIKFTSATGSTDEAQEVAADLASKEPNQYYYADQYNNSSNWKAHYHGTSQEIIEQTEGAVSHFITGLGTTGTFTGTTKGLKEYNKHITSIAVQPDMPMHGLEGWKHLETAKVPGIYDRFLPDEHTSIATEQAHKMIVKAAQHEGLLLSPSSAANLQAAITLSEQIDRGTIVTIFPDDASKYNEIINELFK